MKLEYKQERLQVQPNRFNEAGNTSRKRLQVQPNRFNEAGIQAGKGCRYNRTVLTKLEYKQERLQVQPNRFNEAGMQAGKVAGATEPF